MNSNINKNILNPIDELISYCRIGTTSNETTHTSPSTSTQWALLNVLKDKCLSLGMEVYLSEFGVLYATLKANTHRSIPSLGFMAHVDTAPDYNGHPVYPLIHNHYQGGDIVLKDGIVIKESENPALAKKHGESIITSDGTSLLGADDKAGIAEILAGISNVINSQSEHGDILVAFTPDEEIGEGTDHFDVNRFKADFTYTIDGGCLSEISYENFNACTARVNLKGFSIHPGSGYQKMINASLLAMEFNAHISEYLKDYKTPRTSHDYEGFIHLSSIEGNVAQAHMKYILRAFNEEEFKQYENVFKDIEHLMNEKWGLNTVTVDLKETYYNMHKYITPKMIDLPIQALHALGIQEDILPTRGGTDGAELTYKGLPTPNLGTGGYNFHGPLEWISCEDVIKGSQRIAKMIEICAKI